MNRLEDALGLTIPLIQAGMGGVAGPELAAAVSREGGGGVLALYREPPDAIPALIEATAAHTKRPFGINIIPEVAGPAAAHAQLQAAVGVLPRPGFVTFFGLPAAAAAHLVIRAGQRLVVQVGTRAAAAQALALGADVVVLQGAEAGGHLLGTTDVLTLLAQVRAGHPDAVLVTAGGVATGADLARMLTAGADGAMAGTLFIPAAESRAHPRFKERVIAAGSDDTVITTVFDIGWPGRPHRVIRNPLTESPGRWPARFIAATTAGGRELPVPRYSAATPLAQTTGCVEEMAMYCGRCCERVTSSRPVRSLLLRFRQEYECCGSGGSTNRRAHHDRQVAASDHVAP